jgi:hypothetical protein
MQHRPLFIRLTWITMFLIPAVTGRTQESDAFIQLKKYYFSLPAKVMDTNWLITPIDSGGINYLLPIRQAVQREKNRAVIDTAAHFDLLNDALCRLTDFTSSLWYEKKLLGTLTREEQTNVQQLTKPFLTATLLDAGKFIFQQTAGSRITLFNASYLKPYTYALLAGWLDSLFQQGYRHLALDLLNPLQQPLREITIQDGIFTAEPVIAEFIRLAINTGFKVISCQPDYKISSTHERKKQQAIQLGEYFRKMPGSEKLLVVTQPEMVVLSEDKKPALPFSLYLSTWLGESCVNIDQCTLTPGSIDAMGAYLYDWLQYNKPADKPIVPLQKNQPLLWSDPNYTALIWHPAPAYSNLRPIWMRFNGLKKSIALPAAHQKSWLVQAYYLEEVQKRRPGSCVPADQTYQLAGDGNYYLYLRPGKYRIIYRNMDYTLLTFRDIEVNQ